MSRDSFRPEKGTRQFFQGPHSPPRENISSFEIEQVLNAHPAVAESAVVGVKRESVGYVVRR